MGNNGRLAGVLLLTVVAMCMTSTTASNFKYLKKPYQLLTMKVNYYILPIMSFNMTDLEPHISENTMLAHLLGHHAAYLRKMAAALKEWREEEPDSVFAKESIFEMIKNLDEVPEKYRLRIRNQGGGFVNHAIYFGCFSPNPTNETRLPTTKLLNDIISTFGSYEAFKEQFTQEAVSLFGSGYIWLVRKSFDADAELAIVTTSNQDSPMSDGMMPLLVIDIWEHAYYLKHEHRRNDYVDSWWMIVDWVNVAMMEGFWLTGKVDRTIGIKDEL